MKMGDTITVRKRDKLSGALTDVDVSGVWCVETAGLSSDSNGFVKSGQLILRIPDRISFDIACGDEVCGQSGNWYVVTEIRDNRIGHGDLSHWKVVAKR